MTTRLLLIKQDDLITLSKKPVLFKVYIKLLELTDPLWYGCQLRSYQYMAKVLGFKTKSGAWKAINKLIKMGLISLRNRFLEVPNRGYFYDMD